MVKKKEVPTWAWIVMVILVLLLFYSYLENVKVTNYYKDCVLQEIDTLLEYTDLSKDFIYLLGCYQDGLPTCEILNEKYPEGNGEVFKIKKK